MDIRISDVKSNVADGVITSVDWIAVLFQDDFTATHHETTNFNRNEESPTLIPFEDVTEEAIKGWLADYISPDIEQNLLAKIDKQKNPVTTNRKPWEPIISRDELSDEEFPSVLVKTTLNPELQETVNGN